MIWFIRVFHIWICLHNLYFYYNHIFIICTRRIVPWSQLFLNIFFRICWPIIGQFFYWFIIQQIHIWKTRMNHIIHLLSVSGERCQARHHH
jgi:hypothetical protein